MDAVIGCASVEAGSAWLRYTNTKGSLRTIPWTAVQLAGIGHDEDFKIQIQGVTEAVAPYLSTHDSLWIVTADRSLAHIMIEKEGPAREALLAAMAANIGSNWEGENLRVGEIAELLFRMPEPVKMPAMLTIALVVLGGGVLLAALLLLLVKGRS